MRQLFRDRYLYITFFLCTLIAGVVFGYYMIRSGGVFTLCSDFNLQQIPFASVVNKTIKSGSQWSWSTDLGTQLIAGYSFYNLGSPFYWITLVFPYDTYPYLMGWLFIIKYAFAGAAAYAYATYFLNEKKWGVLVGVLYAFSGFQSFNIMFFHFHDVVALFPLLLIGLEEFIRKDKKTFFIFAVFINCITNYFFFVGEVVFVAMYFLARCFIPEKEQIKQLLYKGLKCVGYAAIGVAMTAVIILPSVLFILGNYRTTSGNPGLFYDRNQYLNLLRAFVWPIDIQSEHATVNSGEWNSISLYLPFWGSSLYISYVIKEIKKKNRLVIFSLVLIVMSFIPLFNSLFYGFTEATYKRWWYMLVLVMALCSARTMENREVYDIRKGIIINAVFSYCFIIIVYFLNLILKLEIVKLNAVVVGLCSLVALVISFVSSDKKDFFYKITIAMTAGVACFTTFCTVKIYRGDTDDRAYLELYRSATMLETRNPQYRYNTNFNIFSLVGDVGNMGDFSSTVSNSVAEFHGNLGLYRENASPYSYDHEYNRILFGGKYELVSSGIGYDAIESDDVCPIGYATSSYITEEELRDYAAENGYDAGVSLLIGSVALKDEDIENYKINDILRHNVGREMSDSLSEIVKDNQKNKVNDFEKDKRGFSCRTNYDSDKVVYFTVPYDAGWSAFIDGEQTSILSSNGFMCVIVPTGEHQIRFNYYTPGLLVGKMFSIVAFLLWVITHDAWKKRGKYAIIS